MAYSGKVYPALGTYWAGGFTEEQRNILSRGTARLGGSQRSFSFMDTGRKIAAGASSVSKGAGRLGSAWKTFAASPYHKAGMEWIGYDLGTAKSVRGPGLGKFATRWLGRGFLGLSAYYGYKEGGLGGAISATGKHLATTYALGLGLKVLGVGAAGITGGAIMAGGLAAAVGAGMGYNWRDLTRPWVNEHMKRHARLEMGTPVMDDFGTVGTMRQRSLQAIQNSRLNGRNALGSEAALTYSPYFR